MSKGTGEYCQAASCEKDNTMYFCPTDFVREKAATAPTLFGCPFLAGADVPMPAPRVSSLSLFSRDFFIFLFFHFKWLKKGSLSPRIPICRSRAPGDVRAHRCNLVQVCHTGLRTNMQNHLQNRPAPTGWSRANKDTFPWIIHQQMWFSVSPGFAEEAVTFVTTNTRLQTSDEIIVVRCNTDLSTAVFLFCPFYQHNCLFTRHQGFSNLLFKGLNLIFRQGQRSRRTADERIHLIQFADNLVPKETATVCPQFGNFFNW